MALDNAVNFGKVAVSTGYDNIATTVILTSGEGAKLPTAPFNATWYNSTDYPDPTDDPNKEIIRVTVKSTDTLTVTRAQEGTAASTHNTGGKSYKMIAGLTAKVINTDLGATFATAAQGTLATNALPKGGGTMTGALLFTDNTIDIGAVGATRPRTIYAGTGATIPALSSTTIELGHATDTTLSRVSAGVIAVEGNTVLTTATGTNSIISNETPTGTINGSNTSFTLAGTPIGSSLKLYLNGQRLTYTTDYTLATATITMVVAPLTGETLRADYELAGAAAGNADTVDNAHLSTDGTLASNSDAKIPSEKAVKTYADTLSDWKTLPALAWVSQDGSTNVVNATGDLTQTLSPGMRLKTKQDQSLTAYWNFNSDSTSQVGSFNGTDTNMSYTAGKFGNAATFNGTTSKIVIADNASLKPTGDFTIGCWFKTGTTGTAKQIFQSFSANASLAGVSLYIETTNVLTLNICKNTGGVAGTDYTKFTCSTTVTDNVLHYIVVSYRNNYCQIYLDGKLEMSGYCLTPAYAATNYIRVGCGNITGTDTVFFNGQIDDLFLINGYALDEKTIKKQYDLQTAQGTGNITIDKYALVTVVGAYSAPNTPITIWGGTDYSLANATISSPYYATVSQPFGFDRNPAKWSVEVSNGTDLVQTTPTQNTWYNVGSLQISVPIGKWLLSWKAALQNGIASGTSVDIYGTLSTANNTESDASFSAIVYVAGATGAVTIVNMQGREGITALSSKTTYYLNSKTGVAGTSALHFNAAGGKTIIKATSTHL